MTGTKVTKEVVEAAIGRLVHGWGLRDKKAKPVAVKVYLAPGWAEYKDLIEDTFPGVPVQYGPAK